MRGLEGVWRGASRHQCLIICLPVSPFYTTHFLVSGGVWKQCGEGSVDEMVRLSGLVG